MPLASIDGKSPVILALPYTGTTMHRGIAQRLDDPSHLVTAPDRYLDRVMLDLHPDMSVIRANFHRFLSDMDYGPPSGETKAVKGMLGVVPLLDRVGQNIWSQPPSAAEATSWRAMCYAPYHAALGAKIARNRAYYGYAVVLNCKARPATIAERSDSDRAEINISTYLGASCAIGLTTRIMTLLKSYDTFSVSLNGRGGGGFATRRYGRPAQDVHVLDLEIDETCYLDIVEDEAFYNAEKAEALRWVLIDLFDFILKWRPA